MPAVTALRCRRPLPPGRDMALVWGAGIAAPGGHTAGTDQRFDYTVRQPFAARFECSRVNPQAGCNPIQKAFVRFTAPIARSTAAQIRIQLPSGRQIAPTFSTDEQHAATISDVSFAAPFQPSTAARLLLPGGITDESGRRLSNAERFPLDVRFDAAPPLVKFAAPFGILESTQGGVLPVTVRNVEPQLQGQALPIGGQALRVEGSDGDVARWVRTVGSAGDYASHDGPRAANGDATRINDTGATSILPPGTATTRLSVALPGRGRDMEVVGIPLARPGFYVVELASPILGQALLGRNAPRYVSTAALVTNMAVHFQWGRERSLVWVTQLDSGQPAPQAAVRITDACTGRLLARGTTDAQGGLMVPAGLPAPESYGGCSESDTTHPLMVSASKADDYSFTLSDWGEGIQPYDFNLPYGYEAPADILHTVFDRTLVRQGETIHMRHYLRTQTAAGFGFSAGLTGTLGAEPFGRRHAVRDSARDRAGRHRRDGVDRAAGRADGRLPAAGEGRRSHHLYRAELPGGRIPPADDARDRIRPARCADPPGARAARPVRRLSVGRRRAQPAGDGADRLFPAHHHPRRL